MAGGRTSDWLGYCLAKPGAWRDEPWDNDVVVKVGDKIFAFFGGGKRPRTVGLKCGDRDAADLLLHRYPGSTAMAYIGRYGWNTFPLDGSIGAEDVQELIDTSYDLVVARLPKSRRP